MIRVCTKTDIGHDNELVTEILFQCRNGLLYGTVCRGGRIANCEDDAPVFGTNSSSGALDVSASQDRTGIVDLAAKEDVVDDLYESFSLKNMLRDEPSPGCEFLLLGDDCK